MKRLLFFILNRIAALMGWRWLYLIAGLGLLSSIHSCKHGIRNCYAPVFQENDSIVEPRCYDRPDPVDTVIKENPTDNIKFE
jgi:hypothetical protein